MTRGITGKKLLRLGSITLLFIVILGYGIWKSRDVLFGIRLSIAGAYTGETFSDPIVTLTGRAKHSIGLSIDGMTVPVAEDGTWTDIISLLPGVNPITITARDKFGTSVTKSLLLYYKAPDTIPAPTGQEPTGSPASAASPAGVQ